VGAGAECGQLYFLVVEVDGFSLAFATLKLLWLAGTYGVFSYFLNRGGTPGMI
jgi:hypothetical protein